MVSRDSSGSGTAEVAANADAAPGRPDSKSLLYSIDDIDLNATIYDEQGVERVLPHRGDMRQIDRIVWHNDDHTRGIAARHIKPDEFWVPGHFPGKPMFPGVLQVEAGAQLACFMFLIRQPDPYLVAFLRIENAAFRSMVVPGDELFLIGKEAKFGRRRFSAYVQGLVKDRIAFEATVSGMCMEPGPEQAGLTRPTPGQPS